MSINNTGSTPPTGTQNTTYGQAAKKTENKNSFDSSDFMLMMLAQLKNQNPLEPMDDSQMMSQMAQLNSVSELQAIHASSDEAAKSSEMSYASSLIGKTITAIDKDGDLAKGVVDGFSYEDGAVYIQFDVWSVPLSWVQEVSGE